MTHTGNNSSSSLNHLIAEAVAASIAQLFLPRLETALSSVLGNLSDATPEDMRPTIVQRAVGDAPLLGELTEEERLVLRVLKPLTAYSLEDIGKMHHDDVLNSAEVQDGLNGLIDLGLLRRMLLAGKTIFALTDEGIEVYNQLPQAFQGGV